jgi:FAD:protein FMN transferase
MESYEFRAMNSDVILLAQGEPENVQRGFEHARACITASEARLTRFSDESELANLNRSGGHWFHASPDLFEIVGEARSLAEQTEGLFDPSILDALERVGYDRSMDAIRVSGPGPLRPAFIPANDFRAVELDETRSAIRLPPGMRIDLGGIAKGWIAERAALVLAGFSSACAVNAGGDMFLTGLLEDREPWQVDLEDPRDPDQVLAMLQVGPGAVATSSITRRTWRQDGRVRHHLIDPRTGESAQTDWLSVTVIAPHATVAEVFAKVLLIVGSQGATELAARRDDIAFIAVDRNGQLWGSPQAREYLDVGIKNT